MHATNSNPAAGTMDLAPDVHDFLRSVRAGQCLALAAWASKILRAKRISVADLERCIVIGFCK